MFIVEVPKEILIAGNKSMVHVFKRVSISDEEAEIRFLRVYGTPPTHLKVKFFRGGVNNCLQIYMRSKRGTPDALGGGISYKPL